MATATKKEHNRRRQLSHANQLLPRWDDASRNDLKLHRKIRFPMAARVIIIRQEGQRQERQEINMMEDTEGWKKSTYSVRVLFLQGGQGMAWGHFGTSQAILALEPKAVPPRTGDDHPGVAFSTPFHLVRPPGAGDLWLVSAAVVRISSVLYTLLLLSCI